MGDQRVELVARRASPRRTSRPCRRRARRRRRGTPRPTSPSAPGGRPLVITLCEITVSDAMCPRRAFGRSSRRRASARLHVRHPERVDVVGPELVQHEDQHALGRLGLPVRPRRQPTAPSTASATTSRPATRPNHRMEPSSSWRAPIVNELIYQRKGTARSCALRGRRPPARRAARVGARRAPGRAPRARREALEQPRAGEAGAERGERPQRPGPLRAERAVERHRARDRGRRSRRAATASARLYS